MIKTLFYHHCFRHIFFWLTETLFSCGQNFKLSVVFCPWYESTCARLHVYDFGFSVSTFLILFCRIHPCVSCMFTTSGLCLLAVLHLSFNPRLFLYPLFSSWHWFVFICSCVPCSYSYFFLGFFLACPFDACLSFLDISLHF